MNYQGALQLLWKKATKVLLQTDFIDSVKHSTSLWQPKIWQLDIDQFKNGVIVIKVQFASWNRTFD